MTDPDPVVCSLGAGDLGRRLAEIAALGAAGLIERRIDGDRQLLRFRSDAETRRRLEAIVAAEASCCPFLDLFLETGEDGLVLSIGAPPAGRPVAEQLAAAFAADC